MKEKQEVVLNKEKPFYKEKWFWVCITVMVSVALVFRPHQIITCGNGNGSANGNNTGE